MILGRISSGIMVTQPSAWNRLRLMGAPRWVGMTSWACTKNLTRVRFLVLAREKAFKELSYEMGLLAKVDSQMYGEYTKMLNGFCM